MWDPESNTSLFSLDDHGVFYRVTRRGCRYLFSRKDGRDVYVSTTSAEVSALDAGLKGLVDPTLVWGVARCSDKSWIIRRGVSHHHCGRGNASPVDRSSMAVVVAATEGAAESDYDSG
ncbi:hypothetical protein B296_00016904 [Ensete ventricosum]|uniref:Uncharacterized protein n=1 Tax=Ensete ventricosum TaxID=4639 RepID=A0A426ZAA9_ENSVE|nr:hypothetical protein B296_00016904 [Ensete ventricosum]